VTDTRKFVWDGWRMLAELQEIEGQDVVRWTYTWGLDLAGQMNGSASLPAGLEAAGTIGGLLGGHYYFGGGGSEDVVGAYCYDGNGNVGQWVGWQGIPLDPNNVILANYEYDPYGNVTAQAGPQATTNHVRFSTKYWDDETGLGYWGYRYYSPTMGRWNSRDPVGIEGSINVYGYAGNEPLAVLDPVGLWATGDHHSLTQNAYWKAVDEVPALRRSEPCAETVLDALIKANDEQDLGRNFEQNFRHFLRDIDQDRDDAIRRFLDYIASEKSNFRDDLGGGVDRHHCQDALTALGHLTHTWQDYYAHSIVVNGPNHSHILWTAQPPITGSPDDPRGASRRIVPASWGGIHRPGEHGTSEVAGPEGSARKEAAVEFVYGKLPQFLKDWSDKCFCAFCGCSKSK
jgi:RHS repeat-associated protein